MPHNERIKTDKTRELFLKKPCCLY